MMVMMIMMMVMINMMKLMVMMLITDQPANRTTLRLTETTHKELNDKDQDEDN